MSTMGVRGRPALVALAAFLVVFSLVANVHPASAYAPRKGDFFSYSETTVVNNGQGSYTGYSDQTQTTGKEQVDSVSGSEVNAHYGYTYQYSNNQGASDSGGLSGNFTWSDGSFTYVNGTDNQVGYSNPIYVWFAMDRSFPVGATFFVLNTQFTVLSKNYSYPLISGNGTYVQTIEAKGTGQYQRNDEYGVFTASYTWYEYFDPATGYIVGYSYVEQDNGQYNGQPGSFTYTDTLGVTSTSYELTRATPPNTKTGEGLGLLVPYFGDLVFLAAIAIIVAAAAYALTRNRRRRSRLPEHPYPPGAPPSPTPAPWESNVDLGSKPPQQVVIRDVAKTNCRYCGTLIPTTVDRCPYCGGPRQ